MIPLKLYPGQTNRNHDLATALILVEVVSRPVSRNKIYVQSGKYWVVKRAVEPDSGLPVDFS